MKPLPRWFRRFLLPGMAVIGFHAACADPFPWVTVTGTSATAARDTGYLLTNPSETSILLPAGRQAGSIVRLVGVGAGGWSAVANKGQSILGLGSVVGVSTLGSNGSISSITSSYDGSKMLAAVAGGLLYQSRDGGSTWAAANAPAGDWVSVAASADGNTQFADITYGNLYVSTPKNGFTTTGAYSDTLGPVACSADGSKVAEVNGGLIAFGLGPPQVPILATGGSSPDEVWSSLASSANGADLVACSLSSQFLVVKFGSTGPAVPMFYGYVYTSHDYGATWTSHAPGQSWTAVATSTDGAKLAAVANASQIYTSVDSGTTWNPTGPTANWTSISCSGDGTELAATAAGVVYTSSDSGASWTSTNIPGNLVYCTGDGQKLVVGNGTQITVMAFPDTSNSQVVTAYGSVLGTQLSTVELIFVGNGLWQVLSHEGSISFQ